MLRAPTGPRAARLEEENAREVGASFPRVRSVLAISAVALWCKAHRWEEAARAGCSFLTEPGSLTAGGRREIEVLMERARRLRIAKGEHDDTIGPKLNRRVRVLGRHEVSEDGEAEDWADDVIPLEEPPRSDPG